MIEWVVNVGVTICFYVNSHRGHNVICFDIVAIWVITVLVQECWVSVVTAGRRAVVEQVLCYVEGQSPDVAE
jgi:hypothetical protein